MDLTKGKSNNNTRGHLREIKLGRASVRRPIKWHSFSKGRQMGSDKMHHEKGLKSIDQIVRKHALWEGKSMKSSLERKPNNVSV